MYFGWCSQRMQYNSFVGSTLFPIHWKLWPTIWQTLRISFFQVGKWAMFVQLDWDIHRKTIVRLCELARIWNMSTCRTTCQARPFRLKLVWYQLSLRCLRQPLGDRESHLDPAYLKHDSFSNNLRDCLTCSLVPLPHGHLDMRWQT